MCFPSREIDTSVSMLLSPPLTRFWGVIVNFTVLPKVGAGGRRIARAAMKRTATTASAPAEIIAALRIV